MYEKEPHKELDTPPKSGWLDTLKVCLIFSRVCEVSAVAKVSDCQPKGPQPG